MRGVVRIVGWMALAVMMGVPEVSLAQELTADEEAHMHFDLGRRYYENGRFSESAEEFERAYALSPIPDLLYNLYLSYRDAGDDVHAAERLRSYVVTLPEGDSQRTLLEARLRTLEARLASAEVASEPTASAPPPASGSGGGMGPAPWIVGGVGAAMLLASIGTGVAALGERDALAATCPMNACAPGFEGARDRGQALAISTDVLWVGGAAVMATGIALLLVDLTSTSDVAVTAACTSDGCVGLASGRF